MKTQLQNPDPVSHTIQHKTKAAKQKGLTDILQRCSLLSSVRQQSLVDRERNALAARLEGFTPEDSVAYRAIKEKFGCLHQFRLLEIAEEIASQAGIKVDRLARRRKIVLIKWFDENWEKLAPHLETLVCEDKPMAWIAQKPIFGGLANHCQIVFSGKVDLPIYSNSSDNIGFGNDGNKRSFALRGQAILYSDSESIENGEYEEVFPINNLPPETLLRNIVDKNPKDNEDWKRYNVLLKNCQHWAKAVTEK